MNKELLKIRINLFTYLLSFLFLGCATIKPIPKKQDKNYSREVEDEFSRIENDKRAVLDYYRNLRQKNWDKYKSSGNKKSGYRSYRPKKSPPAPKVIRKLEKKPVIVEKPPLDGEKREELMIEVRQNLAYYCMENRKSSRFNGSADCSAYTENILNECEKEIPILRDRKILSCVKKGLR